MGTVANYASLSCRMQLKLPAFRIVCSSEVVISRGQVLELVDKELAKGDDKAALSLVKQWQGKPGGLRCFGAARQVPQRLYTLDELKLNGIQTSSLLSPVDATLGSIERNLQLAAALGGLAVWNVLSEFHNYVVIPGGMSPTHEAGHFLIAYLVGILPKGYTLSSLEALKKEGSLNVQAGTAFVDFEFLEEVAGVMGRGVGLGLPLVIHVPWKLCQTYSCYLIRKNFQEERQMGLTPLKRALVNTGKVSATTLNRFACIALAGVATEYLLYGFAEGGLADIEKLDMLLQSLGFTQKKADSQVRWSVLNTVLLLRRHKLARAKLAEAMSMGKSVGSCLGIIEDTIDVSEI
uniref:Peptidase M41 domain-containing protein n=1 Tax=Fagus sylvatica TaxID=28930 RepID=A0A2N9FD39_FAGSY